MKEDKRNTNPRWTCKVKSKTTQNLLKGTQNSKKFQKSTTCVQVGQMGKWSIISGSTESRTLRESWRWTAYIPAYSW